MTTLAPVVAADITTKEQPQLRQQEQHQHLQQPNNNHDENMKSTTSPTKTSSPPPAQSHESTTTNDDNTAMDTTPESGSTTDTSVFPMELSRIVSEVARCGHCSTLSWTTTHGSIHRGEPPRKRKNGLKRSHSTSTSSMTEFDSDDSTSQHGHYKSLREALAHALVLVLDRAFKRNGYKPSLAEKKKCEAVFKKNPGAILSVTSDKSSPPGQNKGPIAEAAFRDRRDRLLATLCVTSSSTRGFRQSRCGTSAPPQNTNKRKRAQMEPVRSDVISSPPFTIQRVAEILSTSEKYYTQTHKLCNGLEKLLLVRSSSNAFGGSSGGEVIQRLNEEREIKLLANERGREQQLRRFKRRSTSGTTSSPPSVSLSQTSPDFTSRSIDDTDVGSCETSTQPNRFSPPYDFHESGPSNDVVAVTAAAAVISKQLTNNPTNGSSVGQSTDGKETIKPVLSHGSNGVLLHNNSGVTDKDNPVTSKPSLNGFLKTNGESSSSFTTKFMSLSDPDIDACPFLSKSVKTSERNSCLNRPTSPPPSCPFPVQDSLPAKVTALSSPAKPKTEQMESKASDVAMVTERGKEEDPTPSLEKSAVAPKPSSPTLMSIQTSDKDVGSETAEQMSTCSMTSSAGPLLPTTSEQMVYDLEVTSASLACATAPSLASHVADLKDLEGRFSGSASDSESGDDVDDSASDRSDGSDSGGYNEPFTAARLMALNRIQQQQRREQFLHNRALASLTATGDFRPPPDSEYQSGDSIDSTMAEDSGGSDSSSSDLAD